MTAATAAGSAPALGTGLAAPVPVRRRRSRRLLLVAVVLVVLAGLAGVLAYREVTDRISVVAVARSVPAGQSIDVADLRELQLPADTGLATVAWADVDHVVGLEAATDLAADTALSPDEVTAVRPPAPGEAVVGLSLAAGRAPASPLTVRDEVLVIAADGVPPVRATVVRPGSLDDNGRLLVDLVVADGSATDLARAAVDDRTVLVLVGRR
jgi:hypothetical protein